MTEKEFNELWNQLQKRKTKLIITQNDIDHVKLINLDYFDHDECVIIQNLHKELLRLSQRNNDSNEVGILVNLCNWSHTVIYGVENGITLRNVPYAKELITTAPKNSLLFFHNHPNCSIFSEKDLESFLTSDSILMISVVCNNGRLYFLIKTEFFEKEQAMIYYESVFDSPESGSIKEFIRTCKKVGLHFKYGGE